MSDLRLDLFGPVAPTATKRCVRCRLTKPILGFNKNQKRCRECSLETGRAYQNSHRDQINASNRASYHSHKAAHRATQKKYEAKLKEKIRSDRTLWARQLWEGARTRARRYGVPFTITRADVLIPDQCPVLGLILKRNVRAIGADSASIDRINPAKGYVPGNVIVVSAKANLIKGNCTADEILRVGLFYSNLVQQ